MREREREREYHHELLHYYYTTTAAAATTSTTTSTTAAAAAAAAATLLHYNTTTYLHELLDLGVRCPAVERDLVTSHMDEFIREDSLNLCVELGEEGVSTVEVGAEWSWWLGSKCREWKRQSSVFV
jgi:hypothetical protein